MSHDLVVAHWERMAIAGALDRLAADVAAVKDMAQEIALRVPSELGRDACDAAVRVLECERDAAVRERDEARALLWLAQVQRTAAYADRDEARAEVYRLKCSMTETSKERDTAIRERDQWREEARLAVVNRDEARAEVERLKESRDVANRLFGAEQAKVERLQEELDDREQTEQVKRLREANETLHRKSINYIHDRDQYRRERDEARAEVERLKAARDAPQPVGQGISPKVADTQPTGNAAPAAGWLTDEEREVLSALKDMADSHLGSPRVSLVVKALLARAGSPPEQTAALWLTEKERAVVEDIASMIEQWFNLAWSDTDEKRCAVLRSILARAGSPPPQTAPWWLTDEERAEIKHLLLIQRHNTGWTTERHAELDALLSRAGSPPVVEVPAMVFSSGAYEMQKRYRAAMDKAGVQWKEVGRE